MSSERTIFSQLQDRVGTDIELSGNRLTIRLEDDSLACLVETLESIHTEADSISDDYGEGACIGDPAKVAEPA